jgi:membrane-associated protease RseP (regulator of RpoE activity)
MISRSDYRVRTLAQGVASLGQAVFGIAVTLGVLGFAAGVLIAAQTEEGPYVDSNPNLVFGITLALTSVVQAVFLALLGRYAQMRGEFTLWQLEQAAGQAPTATPNARAATLDDRPVTRAEATGNPSPGEVPQYSGRGLGIKFTDSRSMVVSLVYRGSPADAAGVRPGDRVIKVGSEIVDSTRQLIDELERRPARELSLTIERDGAPLTVDIELGSRSTRG